MRPILPLCRRSFGSEPREFALEYAADFSGGSQKTPGAKQDIHSLHSAELLDETPGFADEHADLSFSGCYVDTVNRLSDGTANISRFLQKRTHSKHLQR